jgi:hypothetical protein
MTTEDEVTAARRGLETTSTKAKAKTVNHKALKFQ